MFIKYVLVPDLAHTAKIQTVVLHPLRNVLALGVYDSNYEVLFIEYRFVRAGARLAARTHALGAPPDALSASTKPEDPLGRQMQVELAEELAKEPPGEARRPEEAPGSAEHPEFVLERTIHKEKTGLIVDMRWTAGGDKFYIAKTKSISYYEFDEKNAPPLKVKHMLEDRSEIFAFCLGPAEGEFAYGTLDGRLVVNQQIASMNDALETGKKIVSVVWDPLGKYVCWLNTDNEVSVYNLAARAVENSVKLNLKAEKAEMYSTKEERVMDFSPDLNYLLVPSLDDKKMPFVCALKRASKFNVEYVFAGPFSSITCVRFYPGIFERAGTHFTAFGMGDAFGQISFWELGDKKCKETPLFLLKNDDAGMSIGNLEFDRKGHFCIAATDKKYLMVTCLDTDLEDSIGQRVSVDKYLQEHYGSARPGAKEFMKTFKDLAKPPPPKLPADPQTQPPEEAKKVVKHYKKGRLFDSTAADPGQPAEQTARPPLGDKQPMTFMRNLTVEDKSKMIQEELHAKQPSSLLARDDEDNPSEKKLKTSAVQLRGQAQPAGPEKDSGQKFFLPGLSKIGESGVVTFKNVQICHKASSQDNPYTKLYVKDKWDTTVEGIATFIETNEVFTVVYTSKGLLYILSFESGRRAEIPLKLDNLSRIVLNEQSHLLLLETHGPLKVVDLRYKKITHKSDIRLLLANHYLGSAKLRKAQESADWFREYQHDFNVFLTPKGEPILKLDSMTYLVFSPCFESWAVAPDEFLMKHFDLHDARIVENAKPVNRDYIFEHQIESSLARQLAEDPMGQRAPELMDFISSQDRLATTTNSIARIEEEMLFCIQNGDKAKYNECLKDYLVELAYHKQFEKMKYFLLVTLHSDTTGKERQFLDRIGVKAEVIVNNSLKILERIDYCKMLVQEIRQALETSKLVV